MSSSYYSRLLAKSIALQQSIGSYTHTFHELHHSFPQVTLDALEALLTKLQVQDTVSCSSFLNACPSVVHSLAKECTRLQGDVTNADKKNRYHVMCEIAYFLLIKNAFLVLQAVQAERSTQLTALEHVRGFFVSPIDTKSATTASTVALESSTEQQDTSEPQNREVAAEGDDDSEVDYEAERAAYYAATGSSSGSEAEEDHEKDVSSLADGSDGLCEFHIWERKSSSSPVPRDEEAMALILPSSGEEEGKGKEEMMLVKMLFRYVALVFKDLWQPHVFAAEGVLEKVRGFETLRCCAEAICESMTRHEALREGGIQVLNALFLLLSQTFVADLSACTSFLSTHFAAWFELFTSSSSSSSSSSVVVDVKQLFLGFVKDLVGQTRSGGGEHALLLQELSLSSSEFLHGLPRNAMVQTAIVRFLAGHSSPAKQRLLPRFIESYFSSNAMNELVAELKKLHNNNSNNNNNEEVVELMALLICVSPRVAAHVSRRQVVLQFLRQRALMAPVWGVKTWAEGDPTNSTQQQQSTARRVIIRKKNKSKASENKERKDEVSETNVDVHALFSTSLQTLDDLIHACCTSITRNNNRDDSRVWREMAELVSLLALGERFTRILARNDVLRGKLESFRETLIPLLQQDSDFVVQDDGDTKELDEASSRVDEEREKKEDERARQAMSARDIRTLARTVMTKLKVALDSDKNPSKAD